MKEIERKFLVANDEWKSIPFLAENLIEQFYLKDSCCRIRFLVNLNEPPAVQESKEIALFTYKKNTSNPVIRDEVEFPIPSDKAREIVRLANFHLVRKKRFTLLHGDWEWVIDEYLDYLDGMVIAEIELFEAADKFPFPPWLGEEVTAQAKYTNYNLSISYAQMALLDEERKKRIAAEETKNGA